MKKTYRLKNLDCANCAAKMERAIKKIEGVSFVEINFMAQRLTIEAEDDLLPEILQKAKACIAKVEPDCSIIGV